MQVSYNILNHCLVNPFVDKKTCNEKLMVLSHVTCIGMYLWSLLKIHIEPHHLLPVPVLNPCWQYTTPVKSASLCNVHFMYTYCVFVNSAFSTACVYYVYCISYCQVFFNLCKMCNVWTTHLNFSQIIFLYML